LRRSGGAVCCGATLLAAVAAQQIQLGMNFNRGILIEHMLTK
jgi:hypothetical protein